MNNSSIRVRFAPSPTGHLHIGGLRTAIFNWLFARHHGGTFLLRLEDTDLERSKQEYTDAILNALAWTNIQSDEPMVIQSQRYDRHIQVIEELIKSKRAYRCYCTPADIEKRIGQSASADDEFAKYDGFCRTRNAQDAHGPHVIRFALPDEASVTFNDLIRGPITFEMNQFDDFIIARSDGRPVYNFVVVVDDADMKISHVIRGEDHISNTPKQIMLHQACGFTPPLFAHLPLILGASGQPLSKRDAATSVMDYKRGGYLPDALINYLVRLGWAHGDQEIFTRQELINYFSLENVGKKGSIFDMVKLGWVNSMYMREIKNEVLLLEMKELRPRLQAELNGWSEEQILGLIDLYKQRTRTLNELADELKSVHDGSTPYAIEDISAWVTPDTQKHLEAVADALENLSSFTPAQVNDAVKQVSKQFELKMVNLAQPLRIALIHKTAGPSVFEMLVIFGKDECVKRIRQFITFIKQNKPL